MRSRIGIGRQNDDLLRKRIDDVVSKQSRGSGFADGEWLDPDVGLPFRPVHGLLQRAPYIDRAPDETGNPWRPGVDRAPAESRVTEPLCSTAGPLDELLREIDRRVDGTEAARAHDPLSMGAQDRAASELFDRRPVRRDESFAFATDRWIAQPRHEGLQLRSSGPAMSPFDRASPDPTPRFDAAVGDRNWRPSLEPFAGIPPTAMAPAAQPGRTGDSADGGERLPRGFIPQENDARPLHSIARQLDELAREVNQRETGATEDEIAAFKQRLTALARETETQAERKLLDKGRAVRERWIGATCGIEPDVRAETVLETDARGRSLEPLGGRHDARSDFGDARHHSSAPATPADAGRTGAEFDLSFVLSSIARQRGLDPRAQASDAVLRDGAEPEPLQRDQLVAVPSDRWLVRPEPQRKQAPTTEDRPKPSAVDCVPPPIARARDGRPRRKKPSRATIVPMVRAALAAVLAIAIVVPGAYFARSRMADEPAARPTVAIVHERAPTGEAAASGPLTIMPANSVARFQDLVFQLPRLYGIYAVNSGRLFELDALPGQAPDPRVAVSAPIPRPSRTTLPDGRVAFLLFRRDMATNVPERVPVRVVAKIKRSATDPAAEHRAAAEDSWTIRNIAVDFRVAPVDHNKEMVLLLSEKSDFTLSAGRYALILKGQAYDFTVAGPITDPAHCLERVDAANGGFFHQCQAPQAGTAEVSSLDPPPPSPRSASQPARQGERHAHAEDRAGRSRMPR